MTNPEIGSDGAKRWRNEKGEYHRENGPAIIYLSGTEHWYKNGKYHRINGPALKDSTQEHWMQNGRLHRMDGPAYIAFRGIEEWWINGVLIDIKPILERFDISPDWRNWTDEEKFLVRLAL